MKVSKYAKGIIAGLSPVLIAAQAAVTDGVIEGGEWVAIGVAVLVAVGVLSVPNAPKPPAHIPADDRTPPL